MRVGVYIDGFNLYYGAKSQLGSSPGWRWLDLRALSTHYATWSGAVIHRVVYCTARVNDPADAGMTQRQAFYLQALKDAGSVDVIEEGYYSSWAKEAVMTAEPSGTRAPQALSDAPHLLSWTHGLPVRRTNTGLMLATVRKREEKGSDVNVATHLLTDVLTGDIDAAIVVSNDSDLALPVKVARDHVPVGLINPQTRPLTHALKGAPSDGVGRHWWRRLDPAHVFGSQLPATVGQISKPAGW